MFKMSNNGFIQLNRGDSLELPLFINKGTKTTPIRYSLKDHPDSKVYLGVMECNQPFEYALIKKHYNKDSEINENGDLIIRLKPQDTEYLLPGRYYYEIKLLEGDGTAITIVPKTDFYIY